MFHSGRIDSGGGKFPEKLFAGGVLPHHPESERTGGKSRNVPHHIGRTAETAGPPLDVDHRDRRLRRDPGHPAPKIDIQHQVPDQGNSLAGKPIQNPAVKFILIPPSGHGFAGAGFAGAGFAGAGFAGEALAALRYSGGRKEFK